MIYGPPGTGKSTMARVLAKQSGFNAKFVNASDVRSGPDLVSIIKNALEMNSIEMDGSTT
jgi:Holliday junction resolvasome RuvABC ATP-dependent DNA helicase subunit